MGFLRRSTGQSRTVGAPPEAIDPSDVTTDEAAVCPPAGLPLHVRTLVDEGEMVTTGQAVACLRHDPAIRLTAPISGRVARISLLPGRKLSEIVLFREGDDTITRHHAKQPVTQEDLRSLMQSAGFWPWLRRRPFGGMPASDEVPTGIVVMAADTRPDAPDTRHALEHREEDFTRGLAALGQLTDAPVFVIAHPGALPKGVDTGSARVVLRGRHHPQGSTGLCIHQLCPAGLDAPVWDIHAEDVAALGALLDTGHLPMMRAVRIAGTGLRHARMVRTHPGADLRHLTRAIVAPGPHMVLTGSPLDGQMAHWLAPRDRQVTVLPRDTASRRKHWLIEALGHAPRGTPAIPTAALTQAFGGALPAMPFIRALGAGDDETAMKLGLLSLLEEDIALADYVLSGGGQITGQLRIILDRVRTEMAA